MQQVQSQSIRLHPQNQHYFQYKGEPLLLITSAEHYGAVINKEFNYEKYLNTLAAQGLNYTRIFSGAYVENQQSFGIEQNTLAPAKGQLITPWARSNEPGYINGGNKFNLDQWDEAFFQRLKEFMNLAASLDIIVEVTFFSSTYTDDNWAYSPLHPTNNINLTAEQVPPRSQLHAISNGPLYDYQLKMVKKLVAELNEFDNLIFEIQNEPWADQANTVMKINPFIQEAQPAWVNRVDLATPAALAWQDQMTIMIKQTEQDLPQQHIIAQNYCNFKYPIPHVTDNISIINFHYAYPEAVTWNYGWNRPISFDESGFSGRDPVIYRRQAWNFILSGGAVFNNLDYTFAVGYEDGSFSSETSPGGGGEYLRKQLKVLIDFMADFNLANLKPVYQVVKKSPNVFVKSIGQEGVAYGFYIYNGNKAIIDLDLPSGTYQAQWISPETGKVIQSLQCAQNEGLLRLESPLYQDDIALKLVKQ
ncbi:MAG: hypothetical protein ACNS62_19575 [Candidatus Cyclobacteriaceae bacterium M3_2C_046]